MKRKILFLNTEKHIGGGELSLIYLLDGLKKRGYNFQIVCPPGSLQKRLENIGADVISTELRLLKPIRIKFRNSKFYIFNFFACLFNVFLLFENTVKLFHILNRTKPDLIHANTPEAMGLIAPIAILRNIQVIWHIRVLPRKKSPTEKMYFNILSKLATKVIAVSNAVKECLIQIGVKSDKIVVVHNPIDTDLFRPRTKIFSRKRLNLPIEKIIIGSIGRLYKEKGYNILIDAATKVIKKYPRTIFLIVGREVEKGYMNQLISSIQKNNLQANIILMNWLDDILSLISSLDILVLLSIEQEGFPRSIAEAMACQVNVIGTNIGGTKELIDHKKTGILVPSGNKNAVADAVCYLLQNKKRAYTMAVNGRKKIVNNFSLHHHLQKMDACYKELPHVKNR